MIKNKLWKIFNNDFFFIKKFFQIRRRRLARLADLETSKNEPNNLSVNPTPSGSSIVASPENIVQGSFLNQASTQSGCLEKHTESSPIQDIEAPMEVEDNCEKQLNSSGVDVDSGIENMEVEDSDRKEVTPRSRVSKTKVCLTVVKY